MNNRKWNSANPHQTNAERVLCLCSAGLLRSPTVANVLTQEFSCNTRAAGMEENFALIVVDEVLLSWADTIVVMDYKQAERVSEMCADHKIPEPPIYVADIEDNFEWMDAWLVQSIKDWWATKSDTWN